MWPRLIAQLVELLPHATRLLPMADNYLQTRRDTDRAQTHALSTLSDTLRADVERVAASNGALSKLLLEQQSQVVLLQDTLAVMQTQNLAHTRQLEWLTTDVNAMRVWVKFGTVAILVLLVAIAGLCVQLVLTH